MAEVWHVPTLRFGEEYRSLDQHEVHSHVDGHPLALVSHVNPGIVRRDLLFRQEEATRTLREMRKVRDDVPVILTSGYNEQEVTQMFTGQGLAGFLQKPFRVAELADMLRKVLTVG